MVFTITQLMQRETRNGCHARRAAVGCTKAASYPMTVDYLSNQYCRGLIGLLYACSLGLAYLFNFVVIVYSRWHRLFLTVIFLDTVSQVVTFWLVCLFLRLLVKTVWHQVLSRSKPVVFMWQPSLVFAWISKLSTLWWFVRPSITIIIQAKWCHLKLAAS